MNLHRIDLNLLVYLDVLLRERNVTQAAQQLNLSQPAMSNGLRRLRTLFDDPLLVRTSEGMTPTERALELEPLVRDALSRIDQAVQPRSEFRPQEAQGVFRIMASDYAESTLFPRVLGVLRDAAPGVTLDIMTPSDVSFLDVERGKVDMVINRFGRHAPVLSPDSPVGRHLFVPAEPQPSDPGRFHSRQLPQVRSRLGEQDRYGRGRGRKPR